MVPLSPLRYPSDPTPDSLFPGWGNAFRSIFISNDPNLFGESTKYWKYSEDFLKKKIW